MSKSKASQFRENNPKHSVTFQQLLISKGVENIFYSDVKLDPFGSLETPQNYIHVQ